MDKSRLEAFSDGVLAIIITILVLEIEPPEDATVDALLELWPIYLAYTISFLNIFMMWLNHRHIFASMAQTNYRVLWANGFFLFAASHVPFVTSFAGEFQWQEPLAVALYGLVFLLVAVSLLLLRRTALAVGSDESCVEVHIRESKVGVAFIIAFAVAIGLSTVDTYLSLAIYTAIPILRVVMGSPYR